MGIFDWRKKSLPVKVSETEEEVKERKARKILEIIFFGERFSYRHDLSHFFFLHFDHYAHGLQGFFPENLKLPDQWWTLHDRQQRNVFLTLLVNLFRDPEHKDGFIKFLLSRQKQDQEECEQKKAILEDAYEKTSVWGIKKAIEEEEHDFRSRWGGEWRGIRMALRLSYDDLVEIVDMATKEKWGNDKIEASSWERVYRLKG